MKHCTVPFAILLCYVGVCLAHPVFADDAKAAFDFAEGLFVHQDYGSAIEEFQALLKQHPDSPQAQAARFRIGEAYLRLQRFDQAAAAYTEAIQKHPKAPEAPLGNYNLGRCRLRLDDHAAALVAFTAAARAGQGEVREESLVGQAECEVRLERFEPALTSYEALLHDFPKSEHAPEAMFSRGWLLARLERPADAITAFRKLLSAHPDAAVVPRARLALSDAHTALNQHDKAAKALRGLEDNRELAEQVLLRTAWNHFRAGDKEAAARAFADFAKRFPHSPHAPAALFNAGIARFDLKQFEQAATHFEALRTRHLQAPETPRAGYWRAVCFFHLAEFAPAVEALAPYADEPERLPESQRDTAHWLLAQALMRLDRHHEAVTRLRSFRERYPASPHEPAATYSLGNALARTGELEAALALLQELIPRLPDGELRRNARFAAAEYAARLKRPETTVELLRPLAEDADAQIPPDVRYRLAWAHYQRQEYAKALPYFATLAQTEGQFRNEAVFLTGRIHEQEENREAAMAAYESLRKQEGTDAFTQQAMHRLGFLYPMEEAANNLAWYSRLFPEGEHLPRMQLRVAELRFDAGRIDDAARLYHDLIERQPPPQALAAAHYGLGWCHLKQNHTEKADSCFAHVLELNDVPNDVRADATLQRGEIAYRAERYEDALAAFTQLHEHTGLGERALYMSAWASQKLDRPEDAARLFEQVLAKHPGGAFHRDAALQFARHLAATGNPQRAREILATAIGTADAPAPDEDLYHEMAEAQRALRDWKGLLETCESMGRRFADSPRAYLVPFRTGLAYQNLGIHEKAENAFRETIAATDTIAAARAQFNIGAIRFEQKRYVEAAKEFLKAEMLYDYPEVAPRAMYRAIECFRKAGENERAQLHIQRLKTAYPDSEWAAKVTTPDAD